MVSYGMNNANKRFFRRKLPHYQPSNSIFFITFRQYGSLPASVLQQLKEEYNSELRLLAEERDRDVFASAKRSLQKRYFERFDEFWERCADSPKYLVLPEIAEIVCDTLHYWGSKRYTLVCYCIMPNHVHMVIDILNFTPMEYLKKQTYELSRIMESIKRYTARRSNTALRRSGRFWQKENYDHVVRDGHDLDRIMRYIIENPVKAGLVESWDQWKWTYINYDYFIL
jgi:putative transposase